VHEDVVAAFALDEAVPLLVREPFDGALSQNPSSLQKTNGSNTEPPTVI
jgi:hypothetical protein